MRGGFERNEKLEKKKFIKKRDKKELKDELGTSRKSLAEAFEKKGHKAVKIKYKKRGLEVGGSLAKSKRLRGETS